MKKNIYENPAVFEVRPPKKEKNLGEDLRSGIMREKGEKKIWQHPLLYVGIAISILVIFFAVFLLTLLY